MTAPSAQIAAPAEAAPAPAAGPDTRGLIFGLQRFSTEDGPGIRTTVFVKGCPMRCPWCQNPEGLAPGKQVLWARARCLGDGGCVNACPHGALAREGGATRVDPAVCQACGTCADFCPANALEVAGWERTAREVAANVLRDRGFYERSGGGVTFSGGEPLTQPDFVAAALDLLGAAGVHRALDTCGAAGPATLRALLGRVELVLFDLKHMDPDRHLEQTGIRLDKVLECAREVKRAGVPCWVRTPVIPGHTDDEANIRAIARFVKAELPRAARYDLLAFSKLCVSKYEQLGRQGAVVARLPLVPRSHMERLRAVALEEGLSTVVWSGMTAT
ncbi:MAG: glycyl-radical enzyme activating protein [Deltaproteobacteria bacterium]|nr:glycyl-radical enzyme activating protein [Deltaproteobacteria bacterium]